MGTLRLLLALGVALSHSQGFPVIGGPIPASHGFYPLGGGECVEAFFVISGFYMALVISTKYRAGEAFPLNFYAARALRLLPSYWVVLAVLFAYGLAGHPVGNWAERIAHPHISDAALIFSFVFIIGQDWIMLLPGGAGYLPLPPAWSVAMEMTFYVAATVRGLMTVRVAAAIAVVTLTAKVVICERVGVGGITETINFRYYVMPLEAGFFFLGVLAFHLYCRIDPRLCAGLGLVLLPIIALVIMLFGNVVGMIGWRATPWTSLHTVGFCVVLAVATPFIFADFKDAAWDRWIGEVSYPLYLVHYPLLQHGGGLGLWVFPTMLLAAAALYVLVDRPIDRWRQRFSRPRTKALSASTTSPWSGSSPGRIPI